MIDLNSCLPILHHSVHLDPTSFLWEASKYSMIATSVSTGLLVILFAPFCSFFSPLKNVIFSDTITKPIHSILNVVTI